MESSTLNIDYIVVGAGSSGCVVAKRLAERARVLLIEAGSNKRSPLIVEPMKYGQAFRSEFDWQYLTVEQKYSAYRKILWPRGKVLGGTSAINGLAWIFGNKQNYDQWEADGNKGWSYNSVLPYFKRAENNSRGLSKYHGVGGPVSVIDIPPEKLSPAGHACVAAAKECGFNYNPDANADNQEGVTVLQVNQFPNFTRCSSSDAYVLPFAHLPNFHIWTNTHVNRVIFKNHIAIGVEVVRDGKIQVIKVRNEVILCGGAIGSAQILMLSGIGPKSHLESVGIQPLIDLSVGQNLLDHTWVPVAYSSKIPFEHKQYANHVEVTLFIKTKYHTGIPDIQILQCNILSGDELQTEKPAQYGFLLLPVLLYPENIGSITLNSRNPQDSPIINPEYLVKEIDLNRLVEGVKICRQIAAASPFNTIRNVELIPGSNVKTDEDIKQFVINHLDTLYHPVGTCKMGPSLDPTAVVDPCLKVHGVDCLRVADASIMPKIVGGNTHAPCVMIGEKAADLILAEYKSKL